MFKSSILLLSFALGFDLIYAYGGGAPTEVCQTMIPEHGVSPQTTPSPYKIQVDKKSVRPGEKVVLTIQAPKDKEFKGFFVQARDQSNTTVGSFSPVTDTKVIDCPPGKKNAVTHNSDKKKKTITLTWTAPSQKKPVYFIATIALNGGEFWVGQKTDTIRIA